MTATEEIAIANPRRTGPTRPRSKPRSPASRTRRPWPVNRGSRPSPRTASRSRSRTSSRHTKGRHHRAGPWPQGEGGSNSYGRPSLSAGGHLHKRDERPGPKRASRRVGGGETLREKSVRLAREDDPPRVLLLPQRASGTMSRGGVWAFVSARVSAGSKNQAPGSLPSGSRMRRSIASMRRSRSISPFAWRSLSCSSMREARQRSSRSLYRSRTGLELPPS
jgi:hypothetical protein